MSIYIVFTDAATTEIYTLSPTRRSSDLDRRAPADAAAALRAAGAQRLDLDRLPRDPGDRKSTRLNSSHVEISYAVFCLKKKRFHFHDILLSGGSKAVHLNGVSGLRQAFY